MDLQFGVKNRIIGYVDLVPKKNVYQLDFYSAEAVRANRSAFTFLPGISYFDNSTRERYARVVGEISDFNLCCPIIDKNAMVSSSSKIGVGTVVFPGAIIGRDVNIGKGCVINSGAIIEHGSKIGDYCHVAPGATICGQVSVGSFSLVGAGSTIINNVDLHDWSLVKAGAAVVKGK